MGDAKHQSAVIRPATMADIDGVAELGIKALELNALPGLGIDRSKIYANAAECIGKNSNYAMVADIDGAIRGSLCALVHPLMFHEKNQASVIQFWSDYPGAGVKLIRAFLRWANNRESIKLICFTLESGSDPRIGKLLKRLGLTEESPVYIGLKS